MDALYMGRDTDCLASVSAGLAGAWRGSFGISKKGIRQVNEASRANELTVTDMTIEEQAQGLYEALLVRRDSLRDSLDALDQLL
jgi:hypothetical protein